MGGRGRLLRSCLARARRLRLRRRYRRPRGFNRHLRRGVRFWRAQGEPVAALLSPVLLGIPVYAFLARRLRSSQWRVMWTVLVAALLWTSLLYFSAAEVLELSALLRQHLA